MWGPLGGVGDRYMGMGLLGGLGDRYRVLHGHGGH